MFDYYSEVILLTKTYNLSDLEIWLNWYSNIIRFDHIVVFDNQSDVSIQNTCNSYSNVEYYFIEGFPDQCKLYTEFVNNRSRSKWVIALDDDEILYIGDKYQNSVNVFLSEMESLNANFKIGVEWVYMISKNPMGVRRDSYINTHIFRSSDIKYSIPHRYDNSISMIKTFVNTTYKVEYGSLSNRKNKVNCHNPYLLDGNKPAILEDGRSTYSSGFKKAVFNPNIFIAHYLFKSRSEWHQKCLKPIVCFPNRTLSYMSDIYDDWFHPENEDKKIWCPYVKALFHHTSFHHTSFHHTLHHYISHI